VDCKKRKPEDTCNKIFFIGKLIIQVDLFVLFFVVCWAISKHTKVSSLPRGVTFYWVIFRKTTFCILKLQRWDYFF